MRTSVGRGRRGAARCYDGRVSVRTLGTPDHNRCHEYLSHGDSALLIAPMIASAAFDRDGFQSATSFASPSFLTRSAVRLFVQPVV